MMFHHLENMHRQNKIEINTIRHQPKTRRKKEINLQKVLVIFIVSSTTLTVNIFINL